MYYYYYYYWQNLDCPINNPEFYQESSFIQGCMHQYTTALSSLNCEDFEPLVHAEAKDSDVAIASEAVISRLLAIQDGPDLWSCIPQEDRSSPGTGSGASAPGGDRDNVLTRPGGGLHEDFNWPQDCYT
jgi:hypothetical protein